MTDKELKKKFFDFFITKNHKLIRSSSLIPENDPTVLFTTAGMQPLVPYLIGEKHPEGKRLVNAQKCLRTIDIDEVGDATHHTFFEMLGNWSLGDYFKKETIEYSWEFLTEVLKLDKKNLAISIFGGNNDIKEYDEESEKYWLELGIPKERILKLEDNWWGPAGETGPCGPDTEIFYWTGEEKAPELFDEEDSRWVEIWNNVLMGYSKTKEGNYEELKQKNIDTGMGFERTLAVLNNLDDNYLTELFQPTIHKIEDISKKKYENYFKEFRIISDHIRSSVFLLGDQGDITPGNTGQAYILRRLIRRAIRFAKNIDIDKVFTNELAELIIDQYKEEYPELEENKDKILLELEKEEVQFNKTLEKGLKEFNKLIEKNNLDGKQAFNLFSTYGFPLEMTLELAKEKDLNLSKEDYEKEFIKHQELSRTASAGMFKGGLANDGEMSKKYHTATHLLQQALRDVLGNHVEQKGSNITEKRLRFDFSHDNKLTDEEKEKVENIVNEKIQKGLDISYEEMSIEDAKKNGAIGLFDSKYNEKVKVYSIGNYSKEICGGPHIKNTKELGVFKIKKEQSSSSGVRRIKAILTN